MLCWIYITVKNTLVYDHVGNTYRVIRGRGSISRSVNELDYEQKSLLQDLRMQDVLTNWIKQGEEFLQQIVSGFYDPNTILKNLSEQDGHKG